MAIIRALSAVALRESRDDRRSSTRYPITLELQYILLNKGRVECRGFGRTLDISSGGVLFEADAVLPAGGPIELGMNWPLVLEDVCILKLAVRGHIIRRDAKATAVRVEFHEFRTAGVLPAKTSSGREVAELRNVPLTKVAANSPERR